MGRAGDEAPDRPRLQPHRVLQLQENRRLTLFLCRSLWHVAQEERLRLAALNSGSDIRLTHVCQARGLEHQRSLSLS